MVERWWAMALVLVGFVTLLAADLAPAMAQERTPLLRQQAPVTGVARACVLGGQRIAPNTIVADVRAGQLRRQQCVNGRFIAFTPQAGIGSLQTTAPPGDSEHSCGDGGCNCWGDSDCSQLVDSGKCHGNPLTCDPANPQSCHCK